MKKNILQLYTGAALALSGLLACSNFDDSTSLGSRIINDVDANKVNSGHFRSLYIDSTRIQERKSWGPATNDTVFGLHYAGNSSRIVLGTYGCEHANGFVTLYCPPDTNATPFFRHTDMLKSIRLIFQRDTAQGRRSAAPCILYAARNKLAALHPDQNSIIDTLEWKDSTGAFDPKKVFDTITIDTVGFHYKLRDSIFRACTTHTRPTDSLRRMFYFSLVNSLTDTPQVWLYGNPKLTVTVTRRDTIPKDTTYLTTPLYDSSTTSWFLVSEHAPDSLDTLSYSSSATGRIATIKYDMRPLWDSIGPPAAQTRFISADFVVPNPGWDTCFVKCLTRSTPLSSFLALDSAFAHIGIDAIIGPWQYRYHVMRDTIQAYANGARPPSIYLYLRLMSSSNTSWKHIEWSAHAIPYFKAVIFKPILIEQQRQP